MDVVWEDLLLARSHPALEILDRFPSAGAVARNSRSEERARSGSNPATVVRMSKQETLWPDDLINRLIRYPRAIAMRFRILRLRLLGMQIGQRCWIQKISVPRNPWVIRLEDNGAWKEGWILWRTGGGG